MEYTFKVGDKVLVNGTVDGKRFQNTKAHIVAIGVSRHRIEWGSKEWEEQWNVPESVLTPGIDPYLEHMK